MYLIDDIITYTPQNDHRIDLSIKEHTYMQKGIVRGIIETNLGNMFYNIELTVSGSSNGTIQLVPIPESDLEYAGGGYGQGEQHYPADIPKHGVYVYHATRSKIY